jgi:hypothetical protein
MVIAYMTNGKNKLVTDSYLLISMCFVNMRELVDATFFFSLHALITGNVCDEHEVIKSLPIDSFNCLRICLLGFLDKVKENSSMHQ